MKTMHPKIFKSQEPFIKFSELDKEIDSLKEIMLKNDLENIRDKLKKEYYYKCLSCFELLQNY